MICSSSLLPQSIKYMTVTSCYNLTFSNVNLFSLLRNSFVFCSSLMIVRRSGDRRCWHMCQPLINAQLSSCQIAGPRCPITFNIHFSNSLLYYKLCPFFGRFLVWAISVDSPVSLLGQLVEFCRWGSEAAKGFSRIRAYQGGVSPKQDGGGVW